jgi:hypothetical protein
MPKPRRIPQTLSYLPVFYLPLNLRVVEEVIELARPRCQAFKVPNPVRHVLEHVCCSKGREALL